MRQALIRLLLLLYCGAVVAQGATPAATTQEPQLRIEAGSHAASIRRAALGAQGRWLITAGDDKTARIWSLQQAGPALRIFRPPSGPGVDGRLYGVAAHPQRALVALAGISATQAVIHLFDADTGRHLRRIDARGRDIRRLAWTPNGKLLLAAFSGDPALRAFDEDGKLVFEHPLSAASYELEVSPDGHRVAISSIDARISVFRIDQDNNGAVRFTLERVLASFPGESPAGLSFSPDGEKLAVGFLDGDERNAAGWRTGGPRIQMFEASSGRRLWQVTIDSLDRGNLRAVRFSADGQFLYAGGSGYRAGLQFVLLRRHAASGDAAGELTVANDSVTDLIALPGGQMAYTSADGSWGIVEGLTAIRRLPADYAMLRGARNLQVSASARRVAWSAVGSTAPRGFDLTQRLIFEASNTAPGMTPAGDRLQAINPATFERRLRGWEDNFRPILDGRPVGLEPRDVARAATPLAGSDDLVLGTSRTLRRLGEGGAERWQTSTHTEVRAVKDADNGRLVVTAMSDGTIRWWRSNDGTLLLSLFVARDGRWVVWTESGFYDASAGGEALVGWHVNRGAADGADFFSISRFRANFLRPDVIDRVLDERDVDRALGLANANRQATTAREDGAVRAGDPAATVGSTEERPAVTADLAAATLRQSIPPTLYARIRRDLRVVSGMVEIPFTLRAEPGNRAVQLAVRVDGRPHDVVNIVMPIAQDGQQLGSVQLIAPPHARTVQVFAIAQQSVSEPLEFTLEQPAYAKGPKPTLYVLAIGVSRYARSDYNLNFPAKDARDLVEVIRRQKGGLYRDVVVRTLLDGEARRANILQGLKWLQEQVKPEDIGILFIAGHGLNDAAGRYFFIPHDGRAEQLRSSAISEGEFRTTLSSVKGKAYFFVDTCHAGNVVGGETGESARFNRDVARIINDLSAPEHGVVVLASSSGRQLSQESTRWGNGAFTKAVVEGLGGGADDPKNGEVTFLKLDRFVGDEVRRLTRGEQTPVALTPRGGQFEFPLALVP